MWYISYARELCSSLFPDKQEYDENKLSSYVATVYCNQNVTKKYNHIYHCEKKTNEHMYYFQNGNINEIKIWNYQHAENGKCASIPLPDDILIETNDDL